MVEGTRVRGPVRATDLEAYHDAMRHRQAVPRNAVSVTLGGAIALAEAELEKLRRREGTMQWFADKKRTVLRSWAADTPLDALDARELQAWFDTRIAGGWSPTTARHFSRFLSRVFRVAAKHGWGGTLPLSRVTLPAVAEVAPRVFGWQEALDIVERIRGIRKTDADVLQRDADVLELLLRTGMRRSELARFRLEHFDAVGKTLRVIGKTGPRTIPLSDQAAHCVSRVVKSRDLSGRGFDPRGYEPFKLTPNRITQIFVRWRRRLREPRLTPHAFRRTFTTELIRRGVPLPIIAQLIGHKSLAVLMRYHGAIAPTLREAVQGL